MADKPNEAGNPTPVTLFPVVDLTSITDATGCACVGSQGMGSGGTCQCGTTNGSGNGGS